MQIITLIAVFRCRAQTLTEFRNLFFSDFPEELENYGDFDITNKAEKKQKSQTEASYNKLWGPHILIFFSSFTCYYGCMRDLTM